MPISESDAVALWERIRAFAFDEGGETLTFARRLARENGWPEAYASRAIEEYRRFMFLAVTAGHPVTPSDQVDQVWHLHLAYTRAYWQRWCRDVLQTDVHHGPTKGGQSERDKFLDWYAHTKESYERAFGETPPTDLWPPPEQRFGNDIHFQRVNTMRNWVVPRPRFHRALNWAIAAVLCVFIVLGCAERMGEESEGGDAFLTFFVIVAFFAILYFIRHAIRSGGGKGGGRGGGWWNSGGCGGCSHDSGCGGCGD